MPKAYSMDLREKIINAFANGEGSFQQLAERFNVSVGFIFKLIHRFLDTGEMGPKPQYWWSKTCN